MPLVQGRKFKISKILNFRKSEFKTCCIICLQIIKNSKFNGQIPLGKLKLNHAIITCIIQHFEADFLWKDSLKILNSGIILKTFTQGIL